MISRWREDIAVFIRHRRPPQKRSEQHCYLQLKRSRGFARNYTTRIIKSAARDGSPNIYRAASRPEPRRASFPGLRKQWAKGEVRIWQET
jgi:hypothetical protein